MKKLFSHLYKYKKIYLILFIILTVATGITYIFSRAHDQNNSLKIITDVLISITFSLSVTISISFSFNFNISGDLVLNKNIHGVETNELKTSIKLLTEIKENMKTINTTLSNLKKYGESNQTSKFNRNHFSNVYSIHQEIEQSVKVLKKEISVLTDDKAVKSFEEMILYIEAFINFVYLSFYVNQLLPSHKILVEALSLERMEEYSVVSNKLLEGLADEYKRSIPPLLKKLDT